jgi:ABC-type uncharacterized transport system ATPase subunit
MTKAEENIVQSTEVSPLAIEVSQISMHFRNCEALDGIDLQVPTGSVFAILGENGAGKTTLIKLLTGFLKADFGHLPSSRTRSANQSARNSSTHRLRLRFTSSLRLDASR